MSALLLLHTKLRKAEQSDMSKPSREELRGQDIFRNEIQPLMLMHAKD